MMGAPRIGVATAGKMMLLRLCPAIFTASAESQTLTAYKTAPISHNQASDCFTSGLQYRSANPVSKQITAISAEHQQCLRC